jgi:ATPase subunit of ABC transporter with duplicated ATPase domains
MPLPQDVLPLPRGLVAVTGDERTGKTTLLRGLCTALGAGHALWLDLALPGQDDALPQQVWDALQRECPGWNPELQRELVDALGLAPHVGKALFMLSTGSRRKVALVGLLASGVQVTCLDQPFAALDAASANVVRGFLADMAGHASRTWVVADYTADARLPWARTIALP